MWWLPLLLTYPQDRQRILAAEAEKLEIQLDNDAWQWLMQHHEHNLLAAKNSLMRVRDTFPDQKLIQIEQLYACPTRSVSLHHLRFKRCVIRRLILLSPLKIFQYLIGSGEPESLILWTLSKEMRLLMQLFEQPHNALQLGIWKTKLAYTNKH